MENTFASKKGAPSEENATLLQIIVISSGIFSSSAIATALKAWFDNRKTTLTIQIDGGRKPWYTKAIITILLERENIHVT